MKSYHDITGDGGSRIVEQIVERRARLATFLGSARHVVAIASGKGGVGKSTLCFQLAAALSAAGRRVGVLDADLNGPTQARLAGLPPAPFVPVGAKLAVPASRHGFGVVSMGSLIPESRTLEFDSVAEGDSYTWRATREFAFLEQLLGSLDWGPLDELLIDLPPGPERTAQFAELLGARSRFVLISLPTALARGVVARSAAALAATPARIVGTIENMSGYHCTGCGEVRPLFAAADGELDLPLVGRVPFDPRLAELSDRGEVLDRAAGGPTARALHECAERLVNLLEEEDR